MGLLLCVSSFAAELKFVEHTLASDLKGGYQVVAVDINKDGRTDLIALASGMPELLWFENPGPKGGEWARHVIAGDLPRMINCAPFDTDGDGIPEIGVAWRFENIAKNSIGIVGILRHKGNPREPWSLTEIDRLTTSHRLRWADIDGSGKKVLVNAPLTGAKAEPPNFQDHVPLVFYSPADWKRQTISEANEGVQHGIFVVDWGRRGRDAILSASFSGIHAFQFDGGAWTRTEITDGNPEAWPKSGSSDVTTVRLKDKRVLAAIEPWHGNQVAIYSDAGERSVIDDTLVDGHTILAVDLDQDGTDEVIAGFRGKGRSVYIYRYADGRWSRSALDEGGIAAASCATADLDGDGRPDLACIGSATTNLKWYENKTGVRN